jgi:hypothetical protein
MLVFAQLRARLESAHRISQESVMREWARALSPAAYGAGSMAIVLYFPTLAAILFGVILMGAIVYMIAG